MMGTDKHSVISTDKQMWKMHLEEKANGQDHQEIWIDWSRASSFHGVGDLSKSNYGKCWKGAWAFLVIAFSAMTVYTVEKSIEEFIQNPTVQTYRQEPRAKFVMPDLVICARQIYNISKLKRMGASEQLIDGLLMNSGGDGFIQTLGDFIDSRTTSSKNSTGPSKQQRLLLLLRKEYEQFLERNGRPTFDEVLQRASVDCEKMIQYCSWTSKCCEGAAAVFDYHYGQCYRISPGRKKTQYYPGPGSGIQLVVRGSFDGKTPRKSDVIKGILIDIVQPNQWMMYNYQQISTGVAATIHLSLQKTQRINLPGRAPKCRERAPTEFSRTYTNTIDSLNSTTNGCFYAAWASIYSRYCNCSVLPGLNSSGAGHESWGPPCHPFQDCPVDTDVVDDESAASQALCLPECTHFDYKTWISYGKLDASMYKKTRGGGDVENDLDESSSLLDIYHPVMEFINVKEVQTYTVFTLLGNIGGAAGLWLGASLMSFFQFGFYFAKWFSLRIATFVKRRG